MAKLTLSSYIYNQPVINSTFQHPLDTFNAIICEALLILQSEINLHFSSSEEPNESKLS